MNLEKPTVKRSVTKRGLLVVWPSGLEEALGISAVTRWRWERDGKLPKRDVAIGGRSGWKPETINAALSSPAT
jgi:predicted DNA-binding transcriptional regulator AlpA